MNKKAIVILSAIFLLIVGTLGFLLYTKYITTPASTPTPVVSHVTPTSTVNSTVGKAAIVKLGNDQVVSPALFFDGKGITFFDNQGNLLQASLLDNGGLAELSGKKKLDIPAKANISKILWPAKGNDFIAQLTDSAGKNTWSYFNSNTGVYTDLPPQIESLDWMPSGDRIIYVWVNNNTATLNVANPDLKNWQKLSDLFESDDSIHVSPDGSQILLYQTANTSINSPINSVTADGKVWKGLIKAGQNFGVLWSPDSKKFLYAKKDLDTQKYQLWLYNLTTGLVKNLGFFTTTEKAVWDKDSNVIYASVPQSGTPGGNSLTVDSFYKMDTSSMNKKQYTNSNTPVDGRDLFLNSSSDKLFFKNAQDSALYYLDLTQ